MKNLEVNPFGEEKNWNLMRNLEGSKLLKIEKEEVFYENGRFSNESPIELTFDNCILKFDGFIFIHRKQLIGKSVQYVYDQNTLGFVALSQIRFLELNEDDYRQAYIGFQNPEKLEVLIVYRNAEIIDK